MKISIISDWKINNDKTGYIGEIDAEGTYDTLSDFADAGLKYHICNAILNDGKRNYKKGGFKYIECLQYDFDAGTISSEQVNNQLKQYSHVILGSKNHLKDKQDGKGVIERFHLFIFLDKPISNGELYKFIIKKLAGEYKWTYDKSCCDCVRYFYRHSSILFVNDVSKMNIDAYKKLYNARQLSKMVEEYKAKKNKERRLAEPISLMIKCHKRWDDYTPIEKFKHSKGLKLLEGLADGGDGRYGERMRIAGIMKVNGMSSFDADKLFREFDGYGGKFDEKTLDKLYNN